jgi:hypothetical protein
MGVFRNENAAARHFLDAQQQGKCSKLLRISRLKMGFVEVPKLRSF